MTHLTGSKTKPESDFSWKFDAIGTTWQIVVFQTAGLKKMDLEDLTQAIRKRIETFDKTYSRFRSGSFISRVGGKPGIYKLPEDARVLFDFYQSLVRQTNGLITPLIGDTLEQAGYDKEYSFKRKALRQPLSWEEAVLYKFPELTTKRPVLFDFGAAGKGYLVDLVGEILHQRNLNKFYINAGGDLLSIGYSQTVGLEDPDDTTKVIGDVVVNNEALCGSSGNRRRWNNFHHIINPHTLTSPEDVTAVWVKANTTILADGLSTALFFVEPRLLQKYYSFEYAMIKQDTIVFSPGFGENLYTN